MSGRKCRISFRSGRILLFSLIAIVAAVTGCAPYTMQGRVIEGPNSFITVVSADDPRLNAATNDSGLANVQIDVTLDPNEMRPINEGNTYTDLSGNFSMPISAQGAGFLMYEAQITATGSGFAPVQKTMPLPSGNKCILVVLKEGKGKINRKNNLIDETMRMGEPYMQ
ncbi:hypothetical protein JD969_03270 [Planctomycetota bacterium]|nr:hypothetical protein JD969_03270 [Planctomycetota bacterium]